MTPVTDRVCIGWVVCWDLVNTDETAYSRGPGKWGISLSQNDAYVYRSRRDAREELEEWVSDDTIVNGRIVRLWRTVVWD